MYVILSAGAPPYDSAVNPTTTPRNAPVDFARIVVDCSLERYPCPAQMPDQSNHRLRAPSSGSPTSDKSWRKGHFQRNWSAAGAASGAACSWDR